MRGALLAVALAAATRLTAPPPFAGTLAFQSDRDGQGDIFVIEASGSGLRRLTQDRADDGGPAWSPRGDQIAFHSNRAGNYDIYVMDKDGSNVRRLTDHPADEGQPNWSPDGTWIAFEGERDGRAEIYRIKLETGRVRRITTGLAKKLGPVHSPDGTRLAYMESGLVHWQVALLDLASGESRVLTTGGGNCRPAWSPDGFLLAHVSSRETDKADLWLMDLRRAATWKLPARPGAHNYDPAFSPDGRALAFASTLERHSDKEDWDLYVMDARGGNVTQLTSGRGNDRFPVWRP